MKDLCDEHQIEASSFWNIFGMATVLGLLAENEARDLVVEIFVRSLENRHAGMERRYPVGRDVIPPVDPNNRVTPDSADEMDHPLYATLLRLWEQEIRPLTGCHPALIQIAADAHWNAWAGGYKVDELTVIMWVREYLEDFWNRCREDKAAKAILLRAADGQNLQVNHRVAEIDAAWIAHQGQETVQPFVHPSHCRILA